MYSKLEENIRVYFRDKKEVLAVYLFGSHAKGKARLINDNYFSPVTTIKIPVFVFL
jgi:predicted nucleotidyltransferase